MPQYLHSSVPGLQFVISFFSSELLGEAEGLDGVASREGPLGCVEAHAPSNTVEVSNMRTKKFFIFMLLLLVVGLTGTTSINNRSVLY